MATQFSPSGIDSPLYPRTYGIAPGWKAIITLFGALLGLGGLGAIVYFGFLQPPTDNKLARAGLLLSLVALPLTGMGIYWAAHALTYRVVLTADDIELITPFGTRRLAFAELRGFRFRRSRRQSPTLTLVPKDDGTKQLGIDPMLKRDEVFDAWIARLPDLDKEELRLSEQEIAETVFLELPPGEREAYIQRLKSLATAVNGVTIPLFIVSLLVPDYHHLVTVFLIALPWAIVILVGRYQPFYRIGFKRNDAHPSFIGPLFAAGLMLMIRAQIDIHTFGAGGSAQMALGGGLLLSAAILYVDRWLRTQPGVALVVCGLACLYGLGAGLELDVLMDSAAPGIYPTNVLAKRVYHGKSNTYRLKLAPWGPMTYGNEVQVPATLYRAAQVGSPVCIHSGQGAFGVPWYQVRECEQSRGD